VIGPDFSVLFVNYFATTAATKQSLFKGQVLSPGNRRYFSELLFKLHQFVAQHDSDCCPGDLPLCLESLYKIVITFHALTLSHQNLTLG
jgi:hypothetical protein